MSIEKAADSVECYVRIRPYNPKRLRFKQRFHTFFGFNFRENRGWSRVPSKIIHGGNVFDVREYLLNVRNNDQDPDSEPVFDVVTKDEALALDRKEKKAREERATADKADEIGGVRNPIDMTAGGPRGTEDDDGTKVPSALRGDAPIRRRPRANAE